MQQERWEILKQQLKTSGRVEEESVTEEDGRTIETLITQTSGGRVKVVFIVKPRFLGVQTHYSKRIGSSTTVEAQYSPDETVTVFEVYRWDDATSTWNRIDPSVFDR